CRFAAAASVSLRDRQIAPSRFATDCNASCESRAERADSAPLHDPSCPREGSVSAAPDSPARCCVGRWPQSCTIARPATTPRHRPAATTKSASPYRSGYTGPVLGLHLAADAPSSLVITRVLLCARKFTSTEPSLFGPALRYLRSRRRSSRGSIISTSKAWTSSRACTVTNRGWCTTLAAACSKSAGPVTLAATSAR